METFKTFGYIGNALNQIEYAMKYNGSLGLNCYLGDMNNVTVNQWADLIRGHINKKPNKKISSRI